jgi:hypothetical protein
MNRDRESIRAPPTISLRIPGTFVVDPGKTPHYYPFHFPRGSWISQGAAE